MTIPTNAERKEKVELGREVVKQIDTISNLIVQFRPTGEGGYREIFKTLTQDMQEQLTLGRELLSDYDQILDDGGMLTPDEAGVYERINDYIISKKDAEEMVIDRATLEHLFGSEKEGEQK